MLCSEAPKRLLCAMAAYKPVNQAAVVCVQDWSVCLVACNHSDDYIHANSSSASNLFVWETAIPPPALFHCQWLPVRMCPNKLVMGASELHKRGEENGRFQQY